MTSEYLCREGSATLARVSTPPFRADIVGSFLRPAELAEARRRFASGQIDADALRVAEETAIAELVVREADAGLKLATDGEFRRSW